MLASNLNQLARFRIAQCLGRHRDHTDGRTFPIFARCPQCWRPDLLPIALSPRLLVDPSLFLLFPSFFADAIFGAPASSGPPPRRARLRTSKEKKLWQVAAALPKGFSGRGLPPPVLSTSQSTRTEYASSNLHLNWGRRAAMHPVLLPSVAPSFPLSTQRLQRFPGATRATLAILPFSLAAPGLLFPVAIVVSPLHRPCQRLPVRIPAPSSFSRGPLSFWAIFAFASSFSFPFPFLPPDAAVQPQPASALASNPLLDRSRAPRTASERDGTPKTKHRPAKRPNGVACHKHRHLQVLEFD